MYYIDTVLNLYMELQYFPNIDEQYRLFVFIYANTKNFSVI